MQKASNKLAIDLKIWKINSFCIMVISLTAYQIKLSQESLWIFLTIYIYDISKSDLIYLYSLIIFYIFSNIIFYISFSYVSNQQAIRLFNNTVKLLVWYEKSHNEYQIRIEVTYLNLIHYQWIYWIICYYSIFFHNKIIKL